MLWPRRWVTTSSTTWSNGALSALSSIRVAGATHPLSSVLLASCLRGHTDQRSRWAAGYSHVQRRGLALPATHSRRVDRCGLLQLRLNLRRQGKRFLATLFFIRLWRDLMSPRANIERHFAWLKRYFGLKYFRVQGYLAVTQFVFRVYIAALIFAFLAARHQRPELATLRLKVLAFVNT